MRKLTFFFVLLMVSCSELIDPPKKLVPKDTMAELLADFAINEQLVQVEPRFNLENSTRQELKKKNITGKDFSESYKYYAATGDLEKIMTQAQEIILKKDPASKEYIKNKLKKNKNAPETAK